MANKSIELGREFFSDEHFNGMLDPLEESARSMVDDDIAPEIEFMPVCVAVSVDEDGYSQHTIILPFVYMKDRFAFMSSFGRHLDRAELAVVAVYFMSEAWGAEYDTMQEKVPPSKRADKEECIAIMGRTLDGRTNLRTISIIGRDSGRLVLGKTRDMPFGDDTDKDARSDLLTAFFTGYLSRRLGEMKGMAAESN